MSLFLPACGEWVNKCHNDLYLQSQKWQRFLFWEWLIIGSRGLLRNVLVLTKFAETRIKFKSKWDVFICSTLQTVLWMVIQVRSFLTLQWFESNMSSEESVMWILTFFRLVIFYGVLSGAVAALSPPCDHQVSICTIRWTELLTSDVQQVRCDKCIHYL
jgi:hypothetical protein